MPPRTPKIRLLRDKRRELDDKIVTMKTELAQMLEQAAEFEIAERVLLSLGGDDDDEDQDGNKPKEETAPAKPRRIPSTPDMIVEAIRNVQPMLGSGILPSNILDFIRSKWWPEAQPKDINPVAWRMAREGRLSKIGGNYALPLQLNNPPLGQIGGPRAGAGDDRR
jgi:hypothetical protein